jgi:hypothetical protein
MRAMLHNASDDRFWFVANLFLLGTVAAVMTAALSLG